MRVIYIHFPFSLPPVSPLPPPDAILPLLFVPPPPPSSSSSLTSWMLNQYAIKLANKRNEKRLSAITELTTIMTEDQLPKLDTGQIKQEIDRDGRERERKFKNNNHTNFVSITWDIYMHGLACCIITTTTSALQRPTAVCSVLG